MAVAIIFNTTHNKKNKPQTFIYLFPVASNYYQPGTRLFSTISHNGQIGDFSNQLPERLGEGSATVPVIILRILPAQLASNHFYPNIPKSNVFAPLINSLDIKPLLNNYLSKVNPQPEYSTPSYQPQVSYQEPTYQKPSYQAPAYQKPSYQAPNYQAPSYQAPSFQTPRYQAPSYQAPSYQAPSYQKPNYAESSYQEPDHQEPKYEPNSQYSKEPSQTYQHQTQQDYQNYQTQVPSSEIYRSQSYPTQVIDSHFEIVKSLERDPISYNIQSTTEGKKYLPPTRSQDLLTHENYPSDSHTKVIFKTKEGILDTFLKNISL